MVFMNFLKTFSPKNIFTNFSSAAIPNFFLMFSLFIASLRVSESFFESNGLIHQPVSLSKTASFVPPSTPAIDGIP